MEIKLDANLTFRQLEKDDIDKGFFELLSLLTTAPKVERKLFEEQVDRINNDDNKFVYVIEDVTRKKVIATVSVILEYKFIHELKNVLHIEDVVVDAEYRKQKLGSYLIQFANKFAHEHNCYKSILDCHENLTEFYAKNGYKQSSVSMQMYFEGH